MNLSTSPSSPSTSCSWSGGFWYQARAAKGLDSYFLGGKSIHWLALAISGASSNFDVTGTMWIVTLIGLFGFKSMWNHWMWGFLMGAFFMSSWEMVRRSGVVTGAEWMITRFGTAPRPHRAHRLRLDGGGDFGRVLGLRLRGDRQVRFRLLPCLSADVRGRDFRGDDTLRAPCGLYSVVVTTFPDGNSTTASIVIAALAYARLDPSTLAALPEHWELAGSRVAPVRRSPLPRPIRAMNCSEPW